MIYLISKNPAGEWEHGLGDGKIYEYQTEQEAREDLAITGIDLNSEIYRLIEADSPEEAIA